MNVFVVYAHQDPMSFGSAIHNRTLKFFEGRGDTVTVSDLYGAGFQAVAAKWDFKTSGGAHENYMFEQKRSAQKEADASFAEDIKQEVERLRAADLLVLEFPLWWSAPPAILKGWIDKVFALGVVWDGDHRYSQGYMRGKQVLVTVSAGESESNYSPTGVHKASITQHLFPLLHITLAQTGMDVLLPYIAYNLTVASEDDRAAILAKLDVTLDQYFNSNVAVYLYRH